jgi:hypothetical protein
MSLSTDDPIPFISGAFSHVYKALDLTTGQKVASKSKSFPVAGRYDRIVLTPLQSKSFASTS